MAAKKNKAPVRNDLQLAERSLDQIRTRFHTQEHALLVRVRSLRHAEEEKQRALQLKKDLSELRAGKVELGHSTAARLWENWVLRGFFSAPVTESQLTMSYKRMGEFLQLVKP